MSLNPKDFDGENKENNFEKSLKSSISKVAANNNNSVEDMEYYKNFLTSEIKINIDTNYDELEKQVEK